MSQLADALQSIHLKILKYDPQKQRPITTNEGTYSLEKFGKTLLARLGSRAVKYPEVFEAAHDRNIAEEMLRDFADENGVLVKPKGKVDIEIPPDMQNLTLNMNLAAKGKDERFFLTHPDEVVSKVSGEIYLLIHQMSPLDAASAARKVIPEYLPRRKAGVIEVDNEGKTETIFNVYTPPAWKKAKNTRKVPKDLPPLFKKLVFHLIPSRIEREYFFSWLHASMFSRAYVFLILCGAPGTGKNRLKLVLRALHGHVNTTDGKKSTLTERFNSQLSESTLAWFDELKYDAEMENTMKELQNDSISIERKGVDATRGTKIHASIVISNNKPRDNYIAFDARKFAPLKVTSKRLEESMTPQEIDTLTKKVEDPTKKTFDIEFLAQIALWIKKNGASNKWPNLEYRGPMFWTLAHTSMTRWQKKAVMVLTDPASRVERLGYDAQTKKFKWSIVNDKSLRKNGERSLQFPDFTTVRAFFDVFRDAGGNKSFHTEAIEGDILGDFWVSPLSDKMEIITENSLTIQRERENAKTKKEIYDL